MASLHGKTATAHWQRRSAIRCNKRGRTGSAAAAVSMNGSTGSVAPTRQVLSEGVLDALKTHQVVQDYYGSVLKTSDDLKTDACCCSEPPHWIIQGLIEQLPEEIVAKFYGCGAPLPLGIKGLRVLDLGCGSGRDCYVSSSLVGEAGSVTGVDMTAGQLAVADKYVEEHTRRLGYAKPNMTFLKGRIEELGAVGIQDGSMDLVISNCVINLSPNKAQILREVHRCLATGGEFYFSDVYCDRRLPESTRSHKVLWGECLAGALYIQDFDRLARDAGFGDPRVLSMNPISVKDPELQKVLGAAQFYSITYRLFKLPPGLLESACEDYGQVAIYHGTVEGHESQYVLDDHHTFEAGKPALVCGNTAAMLGEGGHSWLAPHFRILGDRSVHYGLFDCGTGPGALCGIGQLPSAGPGAAGGSCC